MVDRYDKADIVAVIGIGLAIMDMSNMAPISLDLIGEGGLGLAGLAIASNLYHKHRASIVPTIDGWRHKVFGSEHIDGDEETIERVIDVAEDVAEDLLDDGIINDSN
jgi:hypothetical protein